MRNKLIIILLLLIGKELSAQNFARYSISYAPTIAKINPESFGLIKWKYGQQIFFFRRWHAGNRFAFRLGLGYSYLHMQKDDDHPPGTFTALRDYKHQDLILPFQIQYYLSSKPNRWYGAAGVMPAIKLDRKIIATYSAPSLQPPLVRDVTQEEHYSVLEGFISLSGGYEFALRGGSRFYIQPGMQANLLTKLYYRYQQNHNYSKVGSYTPPPVGTIGVELGYLFR